MKPIDLFYTPKSMDEMQDILDSLPASQRSLVYPYVMMMCNLMIEQLSKSKPVTS
jgi:hypothetical protein